MTYLLPFFLRYLLMPLLASLSVTWLAITRRKNRILTNRKLIIFTLLISLVIALPGLTGLIDLWFMPAFYIIAQIIYVGLGVVYLYQLKRFLAENFGKNSMAEILLTLLIMLVGGYLFSLIFDYFSELNYGLRAATCLLPFGIPLLFERAYRAMLAIPSEIYKIWYYPTNAREVVLEGVDYLKLTMLEVEVRKDTIDGEPPIRIKARTTQDMPFGMWFQKFVDDYNYKFPYAPIRVSDTSTEMYGWMFYVKPSLFRFRRYIDYEQTIEQNKLKERYTLVAKRVKELKQ